MTLHHWDLQLSPSLHSFSLPTMQVRAISVLSIYFLSYLCDFSYYKFYFPAIIPGWAPDFVWITLAVFYGGIAQFAAGMTMHWGPLLLPPMAHSGFLLGSLSSS